MSTLTVTNIKATGETASRAVSGVAAAWVNFNGTGTIAARDSENVSSLTDNGTGQYGLNFSSAFSAGDYAVACSASDQAITNTDTFINAITEAAGSVNIGVLSSGTGNLTIDRVLCSATMTGDLA